MIKKLEEIIAPVVLELGYELYDMEYVKEGGERILRIFIDTEKGISLSDCEIASNAIESALDTADPIPDTYRLQVGSPGIDRKLKKPSHFERYIGNKIAIKFFAAMDVGGERRKKIEGTLVGLADGFITITDSNDCSIRIESNKVSICRLAVDF